MFSHALKLLRAVAAMVIVLAIPGCGSGHSPFVSVPLAILAQPQDAATPLGQSATFSVIAQGTGTLTYQWSLNGTDIQGATSASYSTPPVTTNNTGEKFSVSVRDNKTSITSNTAELTVGPRSPASGDLRFKQVDAPSTASGLAGQASFYLKYPFGATYQNVLGSVLRPGGGVCVAGVPQDCYWYCYTVPVAPKLSLSAGYYSDLLNNLDEDLNIYSTSNTVVTSWDIRAGNDVFGMSWMQGPASGFDYRHEVVSLSGLQTQVASDGAHGRVVTAISFNGAGQASLLSYGWASDKTTVYDTAVATATYDQIAAQAKALADAGYIITAFGGDPTSGYIIIGTRVHGDSMPRPILTFPPAASGTSVNGYALVAQAFGPNADGVVSIFEK